MMDSNLKNIKKIPIIKDVIEITFSKDTEDKLGLIMPTTNIQKLKDNSAKVRIYKIIYHSGKNNVVGFIIQPKKREKLPCIIYNRGGSGDFGVIKLGHLFGRMAELSMQGYIVIASNYSGSVGSEGVDDCGGKNLDDILNLKKILKKYPFADTSRIGMYGWSRGGAMTYMCLAKVKWLKAIVTGGAPTDEVNAPKFRKGWRKHQISMYGKSRVEQIKRSALYWCKRFPKKTPILIMHGLSDWRVNPLDSIRLSEKLYEYKIPFRLILLEGGDHSISEHKAEKEKNTYEWFERFVKNRHKLPDLNPHGK